MIGVTSFYIPPEGIYQDSLIKPSADILHSSKMQSLVMEVMMVVVVVMVTVNDND